MSAAERPSSVMVVDIGSPRQMTKLDRQFFPMVIDFRVLHAYIRIYLGDGWLCSRAQHSFSFPGSVLARRKPWIVPLRGGRPFDSVTAGNVFTNRLQPRRIREDEPLVSLGARCIEEVP